MVCYTWDEDVVLEYTERGEDNNHVGGIHVAPNMFMFGADLLETVLMYKIDSVRSQL